MLGIKTFKQEFLWGQDCAKCFLYKGHRWFVQIRLLFEILCSPHSFLKKRFHRTVAAWLVDWETLSLVVYHIPELPQGRWHSWTLCPWQWGSSAGRVLAPAPGSPCPISEPLESSLQDTKIGQFDHCLVWNHKELAAKEHTGCLWNCHPFKSAYRAASKMIPWGIKL